MKPNPKNTARKQEACDSDLLVLPDGRILVHNLTQPMAELLRQLNPNDRQIAPRALPHPAARLTPLAS